MKGLGVTPVIADLSDLTKVEDIAADFDGVVHTATLGGPVPGKTMEEAVSDAVAVTQGLADIAARQNARLVVMSDTSIYGPTGGKTVDETAPAQVPPFLQPLVEMEHAFASEGRATFLRSSVVFGRDQSAPMKVAIDGVRNRGKGAIVDPANRLSVVYVDDLADLLVLILEADKSPSVVNGVGAICLGQISWGRLVRLLASGQNGTRFNQMTLTLSAA